MMQAQAPRMDSTSDDDKFNRLYDLIVNMKTEMDTKFNELNTKVDAIAKRQDSLDAELKHVQVQFKIGAYSRLPWWQNHRVVNNAAQAVGTMTTFILVSIAVYTAMNN